MVKLLMVDNYDSFTYNLVQAFLVLGAEVRVLRNDEVTVDQAARMDITHLCISPGPGTPRDAERGIARRPAVRADGAVHAGLAAGARRRRLRGRQPAKRGIEGQGGRSGGFLAVDLAGSRAVAASPVPT